MELGEGEWTEGRGGSPWHISTSCPAVGVGGAQLAQPVMYTSSHSSASRARLLHLHSFALPHGPIVAPAPCTGPPHLSVPTIPFDPAASASISLSLEACAKLVCHCGLSPSGLTRCYTAY